MEQIIAGPEHAIVMRHLEHSDPVHKVSIISRGMARGSGLKSHRSSGMCKEWGEAI